MDQKNQEYRKREKRSARIKKWIKAHQEINPDKKFIEQIKFLDIFDALHQIFKENIPKGVLQWIITIFPLFPLYLIFYFLCICGAAIFFFFTLAEQFFAYLLSETRSKIAQTENITNARIYSLIVIFANILWCVFFAISLPFYAISTIISVILIRKGRVRKGLIGVIISILIIYLIDYFILNGLILNSIIYGYEQTANWIKNLTKGDLAESLLPPSFRD